MMRWRTLSSHRMTCGAKQDSSLETKINTLAAEWEAKKWLINSQHFTTPLAALALVTATCEVRVTKFGAFVKCFSFYDTTRTNWFVFTDLSKLVGGPTAESRFNKIGKRFTFFLLSRRIADASICSHELIRCLTRCLPKTNSNNWKFVWSPWMDLGFTFEKWYKSIIALWKYLG